MPRAPRRSASKSRALLAWLLAALGLSAPIYLYSHASLPAPRVNVRWAPGVDAQQRATVETRFRLTEGEFQGGRTWSYRIGNVRPANIRAVLEDPRIEDTHGIDNRSLQVAGAPGPLKGLGMALVLGFGVSTLALVGVAHRRTIFTTLMLAWITLRRIMAALPSTISRESRFSSATFLAASVLIATMVKAPSWSAIAWDDEELTMSVLTTALQARYWADGIWLPLWNTFQGFGLPHPSVTHLIYSPLFPLMLFLPDGIALALHYSIMTAIGVGSMFVLSRKIGASPLLAAIAALTWFSSSFLTQFLFVDFWTQAFTFASLAPILVILLLDWFETNAGPLKAHNVLLLGLVAGIVLNCTTPAGSVPFAVPLSAMVAVHLRSNSWARVGSLMLAFLLALAMYAPVLLELWQETLRFNASRNHTMVTAYSWMAWTAFLWPVGGYLRSAGFGAPFGAVALFSIIATLRPKREANPITWRPIAAAAAICLVMYMLPVSVFPIASGNGTWGQLLTIFAIPLAASQITAWHRQGRRPLQLLTCVIVAAQLTLVGHWGVRWWSFQKSEDRGQNVGLVLDRRSELERALMQRVQPNRDRVLLSPSSEGLLLRKVDYGHASNFARLGIPLVNGVFRFVSYQSVYPDYDTTWGLILTQGESLAPEVLDVAGISFLVTRDDESPADSSMRRVGRYLSLGKLWFQVWENLDVWPRVVFVDPVLERQGNAEAGIAIWRRRVLPSRLPDVARYVVPRPGTYAIQFEPAQSDRLLLISEVVRSDLMTVSGATVVEQGPFSDVFAILKVPAGTRAVTVTWEAPLRRWLWQLSYLTFALGTFAWVVFKLRDRKTVHRPQAALDVT